jgi:hypothetical protein
MPLVGMPGFKSAETVPVHNRLVLALRGKEKQGKTHFALTAPGPIALFNQDVGLEGVIHKFTSDKVIAVYEFGEYSTKVLADQEWNRFLRAWQMCLARDDLRTIIMDTATDVWELARMAYLGKLTKVMPHNYTEVNSVFRKFIREVYDTDKNLILIMKQKPVYVNDTRTGEWEASGFSDTKYLVQCNAEAFRGRSRLDSDDEDSTWRLQILDNRLTPDITDTELFGDMCTFETLLTLSAQWMADAVMRQAAGVNAK